jgi:hypothetical protein
MAVPALAMLLSLRLATAQAGEVEPVWRPEHMVFEPLPPGAVQPRGWLRDWALAMRRGMTGTKAKGSLFDLGWTGDETQRNRGEGWPLEQSGYWIDGVIRLGHVLQDQELLAKVLPRLEQLASPENRSGSYLHWRGELTYDPGNPQRLDYFNMWACGVLGRALIAHYQATGERRWLTAIERFFAPLREPKILTHWPEMKARPMVNIETIFEATRFGIDPAIWNGLVASTRAEEFERIFLKPLAAGGGKKGNVGHGVTFNEVTKLPLTFYAATGETRFRDAVVSRYQSLYARHLLPNGVNSASEGVCGVNAFHCTETCNVSDVIWGHIWLVRILGEAPYGDRIETAFFNAGPGCISRDCTKHVYYQAPNRISRRLPGVYTSGNMEGERKPVQFRTGHGPACCTGNVNRILPNYIIHMWMRTRDRGLAATLHGPSTVTATVGKGVPVTIETATDYPFAEDLTLTVTPAAPVAFPLLLRVPGWCPQPVLAVNGESVTVAPDRLGFIRIERTFAVGDTVRLCLPMAPRVVLERQTEVQGSKVGIARNGAPYACVYLGPLLFVRGIPEQDENDSLETGWRYALDFDHAQPAAAMKLARHPMPATWDWPAAAPLVLQAPAQAIDWGPELSFAGALPAAPVAGKGAETIDLIPYGCAKFRVSMFPVTAKAWGDR